ncbi:hypothetical protein QBC35DRAFT_5516 [Podospora australis]|uniref:Uncharacterized protein n=1 Tax=Podospora australis TaxID=1536484 RepID=A0AAN6X5H8_9PEZI|nr:hypothetical protein QBC35DRAFT_5516 [Podospora australis]
MAGRYSVELLLYLRQSPLCVKPPGLPPAEEWMGPPPEPYRANQTGQKTNDPRKGLDGALSNQENRRPTLDRNGSRNTANPEDMILGPPRTSFASATSMRNPRLGETEKGLKDTDRQDRTGDRFNFRGRGNNDSDNTGDRFGRDGRNNGFRRRGDQDQDNEGWTAVKPRKSFGNEGAERFQGRMGAAGADRTFAGRGVRDRDDQDSGNRRVRNVDFRTRDQDEEEPETPRRNGLTRGKSEPWFKEGGSSGNAGTANTSEPVPSGRERMERKSWRVPEERPAERQNDRHERGYDRRWDRQTRVDNDPEWLDEPAEEPNQGRTEADFKKFMEEMKAAKGGPKPDEKPVSVAVDKPSTDSFFELDQPKILTAPVNRAEDPFFKYHQINLDVSTPAADSRGPAASKGSKSSRFLSLMNSQEEPKQKAEPPTPAATAPPPPPPPPPPAAAPQTGEAKAAEPDNKEKLAFKLLLQKLQNSGLSSVQASGPPPQSILNRFPEPTPLHEFQHGSNVASPEPYQQYGNDRREDSRFRAPPQPSPYEMVSQRPMGPPVQTPPVSRPEQALQDLLAQRPNLPNMSNARPSPGPPAINSNAEFLMHLMRTRPQREPESPHNEQLMGRVPQPAKQVSLPGMSERDHLEYQRERSASQRQQQQMRGQGPPPGFHDENQYHQPDMDARPPQQPTQILQRPPPPGLDHQMHPFHMAGPTGSGAATGQMPPQRPMIPPPGLLNNGPRNVGPMPNMPFPPSFPPPGVQGPGNFHSGPPPPHSGGIPSGPPDGMVGPPRPMQPPPGFFGGPPPGFMPPGMGGFQGGPGGPLPEGLGPAFGGLPSPYERMDRRGMLPPGYRGGP